MTISQELDLGTNPAKKLTKNKCNKKKHSRLRNPENKCIIQKLASIHIYDSLEFHNSMLQQRKMKLLVKIKQGLADVTSLLLY